MMPATETIGLVAALIAGFAGSAHCFGMCGGFSAALGMRLRHSDSSVPIAVHALLYQVGRIGGYAAMGALCGAFGSALKSLLDIARLGESLRILSGVLLVLVALRILVRWNALAVLERAGARLWKVLQPLTPYLRGNGATQTVLLGALWGLLPCGMVYSMLAFAALSGSASKGFALLAVFGLGTVPAMMGSTLMAAKSVSALNSPLARRASGVILAGLGLWLMVAPLSLYIRELPGHPVHAVHAH
jgi:uncharacterized protein